MAGVVLEDVSRVFPGGVRAVDRVSLSVADREFLVLVGPSGCGKSTTLRMIAGLEDVSSGEIRIGGRLVNQLAPKDRDTAMVFQNYALYPHMSVYKNMAFGLELRHGGGLIKRTIGRLVHRQAPADLAGTRRQIDSEVRAAAEVLGIEGLLERMPGELSGGERQRVALGRAIVRRPAVFLFDEPLSNLDAKLRVQMRRELKLLHRRLGATIIYVTHDQVEALTLGDRIAVMDRGVVQQVGTPEEVYDWPKNQFVAGFMGSPGMNFLEGDLGFGISDLGFKEGIDLLSNGRRVVLGVRPEDVVIEAGGAGGQEAKRLWAEVNVVESTGDATLVSCSILPSADAATRGKNCDVIVRMGPRQQLAVGSQVKLLIDPARAHWFDAATGENLRRPKA